MPSLIFSIIIPVFSVTWSFRKSFYYNDLLLKKTLIIIIIINIETVLLPNICVEM